MLKLINRKDVMGKYTNGPVYNVAVWAMAIVLIMMTLLWLVGMIFGF
jgi:Mn2+/Fe2+ NRAMP family transporter